ncbi:MAG TPA: DUF504 domain-containing protein [Candidatus Methanoperedenaceae archaeon]|nr:DUF504 domain-containing protein [Candidatus Methanoperedenaceae archaeon]
MFKSRFPRELLNEVKWKGFKLEDCTVQYIHRGAPGDVMAISGKEITDIGRMYITLRDGGCIPYHRIVTITYKGHAVFIKNR